MTKLTSWTLCGDHQPSIPGWYDIKFHGSTEPFYLRKWWSGEVWKDEPKKGRCSFGNYPQRWSGDSWRGLAEDPARTTKPEQADTGEKR